MVELEFQKTLFFPSGELKMDVSFQLQEGEWMGLHGPSGSGKTTLLRFMAGLIHPENGSLRIAGETWCDTVSRSFLPPAKRDAAMVFQEFALFPNMTVAQNLAFALKGKEDRSLVENLMQIMQLESLQHQRPDRLSGGQKQRVALARALVRRPRLLLLDEPFSALDTEMKDHLQTYLMELQSQRPITAVLASHSSGDLHRLTGRVTVLSEGKVVRRGIPAMVLSPPRE